MRINKYNILEPLLDWLRVAVRSLDTSNSKDLFFKNLGKKVLAVALSVALWFSANIEHDVEKSISTDVNYVNLPADLVIVNKPPETLSLRIRGPRTQVSPLTPQDISYTLNLSSVSPGVSKFEVHTEQIRLPRETQVIGISPAEITVDVDRVIEKEVNVKPVVGVPESGYEIVDEVEVIPSRVKVRGPKRVISKIEGIFTDLISTSGVKSKFAIEVPLKVPPSVKVIGDETVRVMVDVKERTVVKEFRNMDIKFINFDSVDFEPQGLLKADLVFEGPYSRIRDLNSDEIRVFVDVANLRTGIKKRTQSLKVYVNYPYKSSIILKKKVPDEIRVRLNE